MTLSALSIVGGGRAGCTVAVALAEAGWQVELAVRAPERRAAVEGWLAGLGLATPIAVRSTIDPRLPRALLWAVPDRTLAEAAACPARPGQMRLHLSGVAPAEVLRSDDVLVASLHPLCALPDPVGLDLPQVTTPLDGALMALDGDAPAVNFARALAESMAGRPLVVNARARSAYHAAAALAGNDGLALWALAIDACVRAGLPEAELRAGLLHLAGTSVAAVRRLPPEVPLVRGLTGAVARGDADTLAHHLTALPEPGRELHRRLSLVLLELVATSGTLPEERLRTLRELLDTRPD